MERAKGKKHQVFKLSFDGKLLENLEAILKVLDYIHHNPVSGRWRLTEDFVRYPFLYDLSGENEVRIHDYRRWF